MLLAINSSSSGFCCVFLSER